MGIITGTLGADKIRGTDGIDVILALSGDDTIYGGSGLDTIDGGDGNDTIYANTASQWSDGALNVLNGGAGDDKVFAGYGDAANGGVGFDVLSLDLSTSATGLTVDFRPMTLLDLSGLLTLDLGGAALSGFEAIGTLVGTDQNDTFILGNRGHYGSDVTAGGGDDTVRAGNGTDSILGGTGRDFLNGGGGADVLNGGADSDRLVGGRGRDFLTGGSGADLFQFREGETAVSVKKADVITDFSHAEGDRISLKQIDAEAGTSTNNHFHFIGADKFSGDAGELRSVVADGHTMVFGDMDGDAKADFSIQLTGEIHLVASDFVL